MKIGDKMPEFQIMDQDGNLVESSALLNKGKSIVLYTYPKDNTSGFVQQCTALYQIAVLIHNLKLRYLISNLHNSLL